MTNRSLRHNREFVALWTGQAASALGTSISTLAYPLLILSVTGSPGQAGLVASVLALTTFLVRLPAGVVADRVDRRRLMLLCDAGRIVAVGSIAVAAWFGWVTLAHVLVVAVVEGALGSLFAPAEAVAVRRVVPPGQVQDAVATNETRRQLAALIGPSVGGALFGWGRAWPFVADLLSYAVSFCTVLTVRTDLRPRTAPKGTSFRAEVVEGLRWLWTQRFLRGVTLWLSAAGVLFTSMGLVTLVLARDLGASAGEIGMMFTISGAGGFAGALLSPWLLRQLRAGVVVVGYAWIATGATFALLGVGSVWWLGVVGAVAFFPVPAVNALVMARVAVAVPDEVHGKVFSATTQLTTLLHPVGPVVAGVALEGLGVGLTVVVYGVLFTGLAGLATVHPVLRGER
ncbi:major facilitator superfamily MFS_1 [Kribbella flavida DSM 17836]|uniref:Multidrug efflux pump Tap n=1 Tax=Kribbella flavida (strain DSM 17836 / JCM 10339 / NBRC 14399) TaxID=479435 RepID=D2PMN1_KRIFD|nr:MFS transporter [Kribbella flavida]ADB30775.1 major facilitator superfamily MFS_1 [Kribbella flavida DSM 17836]